MQVIFLIFSVILTSCAILFVDFWLNVIAPGLDERTRDLSRSMLIIMSLGITLYLSSALINYVEMAHDDFLPMSMRPSIQNFGMLLGALFAYIIGNPIYLAWGFTFSYLVFFIWVLIRGLNKGILNLPEKIDSKTLKSVILNFWRTLRPLIFLPFLYQGNIAVERAVATLISITAVSALDYAKFITETLLLVVSTPVALAGLASWGGLQPEHIKARLIETFSLLILFAVPVSLFLGVHANLVVTILFARGKFDSTSIEVTTHILQGMSLGLWANVISYVLIKALNAQFNNKKVMLIMTLGLIVNASFNILFYQFFKEMTLGLGYSLYGIITLAGCIYSLGIWGETSKKFYIIILSSCIYMLISSYEIPISNLYLNFLINGVLFLIFWSAVITLIPSLRGSFAGMIRHKRG